MTRSVSFHDVFDENQDADSHCRPFNELTARINIVASYTNSHGGTGIVFD